jgi:hypothetical protein
VGGGSVYGLTTTPLATLSRRVRLQRPAPGVGIILHASCCADPIVVSAEAASQFAALFKRLTTVEKSLVPPLGTALCALLEDNNLTSSGMATALQHLPLPQKQILFNSALYGDYLKYRTMARMEACILCWRGNYRGR